MPKASTSARPALRRNQACLSCRKRKLKCDASRPHCGTCVKQWQALISVPPPVGYAHPTEPQCSYDPVEGLTIAPDVDPTEKIRILEEQISQLRSQLNHSRACASGSSSPPNLHMYRNGSTSLSISGGRSPEDSPTEAGISMSQAFASLAHGGSPISHRSSSSGSPEVHATARQDPMVDMEMLLSGWDPELPPPEMLHHYVEVFFRCDPCGSRILHRPSFMASLHLHPRDPNFPHSVILHAICASASRWASNDLANSSDGTRRDKFAETHVGKTREYVDRTMATGADIFPVLQACILLSWYFYQEGRWVEVWIFAGFQSRVAVPLRMNYPGTFSPHGSNAPGAYLPPPTTLKELESRRRTWWMAIMFDRIVSVGGWLHSIDERDIGTELPVRTVDFEGDIDIPSNPQDLATKDLFTRHDPHYTDSFLLFLKSVMLFGRVTDYSTRSNLCASAPPSKNQNPFDLPGFAELDRLVCVDFLESFPSRYKLSGITADRGGLDTDLYMAQIVPHAATITLHNSYLNFNDPQSTPTSRCLYATRSILKALTKLSETSLDITRLHPFVTICWYLAAVVQIQLCKYFIEIGDANRESTVWGEINALRFAMLTYGNRSSIGTRQEKLLQGLMTEIVRMSSQPQPLETSVPLYPFSHASLFAKAPDAHEEVSAPLPGSHTFEESPLGPPAQVPAWTSAPVQQQQPVMSWSRPAPAYPMVHMSMMAPRSSAMPVSSYNGGY